MLNNKTTLPRYMALSSVKLDDPFFSPFIGKLRTVSTPDILAKFLKDGAIENYKRVARGETGGHAGPPWYHGLICECITGISDLLAGWDDFTDGGKALYAELDAELDGIADAITEAQAAAPDGYINPYTTLMCPDRRWGLNGGNIRWQHEMYNSGALAEAGVHHYRATGKTSVLACAVKMCNYLASVIGDAPKWNVVAEHSLPELAFISLERLMTEVPDVAKRLGAVSGEYLRLAMFFIDHKGDNETRHTFPKFLQEYAQDHRPAREQREAVGHAVRATLFYTGMADAAAETGDVGLDEAAWAIWRDITETKLHINGAVGAYRQDERFGQQYELPNDAYLETCAGVGLAFFGASVFRLHNDASVWDTVEGTLTNMMPAAVSESGDRYTYENPLEAKAGWSRWDWHGCPCCPPMLLKLTGAMPSYIWARSESNVWLNLYIGSTVSDGDVRLTYDAVSGKITVETDAPVKLRLRIPVWSRDFTVRDADGSAVEYTVENGYAVLDAARSFDITVSINAPVVKLAAHPWVDADHGRVAIMRGPVLYCAEKAVDKWEKLDFELGDIAPVLNPDGTITVEATSGERFTLIEYRRWNNNGALPMRIWFRQSGFSPDTRDLSGWDGRLYRPYAEY